MYPCALRLGVSAENEIVRSPSVKVSLGIVELTGGQKTTEHKLSPLRRGAEVVKPCKKLLKTVDIVHIRAGAPALPL